MSTKSFVQQLINYNVAALIGLAVDFALLVFLVHNHLLHPIPAATLSFIIGHTVHYWATRKYVFHKSSRKHHVAYPLFIISGTMSLFGTVGLMSILLHRSHMYYLLARIIAGCIVGFLNFLFNYYITFKAHLD
jgi:putative flippase GtrA